MRTRGNDAVRPPGYWVIRTYEAGPIGEKTKYWVPGERGDRLSKKAKASLRKAEQNGHAAEKQLARLINANFGPGDLLVGLDYSAAGMAHLEEWAAKQSGWDRTDSAVEMDMIRVAAERELRLALRRVKRELDRVNIELRYVAITSDMDGDSGETVRVHHHLIIPAAAREAFVEKWRKLGGVSWSYLSDQKDYTPIAAYFMRQVRRIPDANKYKTSRNLHRPKPKDRVALSDAELRVPTGGELLHRSAYIPGRPQYIRYVLPTENRRICAPRRKKE